MTDSAYPDLAKVEDWLNAKGYTGEAGACHNAMDKIREQAARIAELEDKLKDEEYVSKDTDEMFHEVRDENIELRARIAELKAALNGLMVYGCPACNGDCSAANPPVIGCPMEAARAAYLGEKE